MAGHRRPAPSQRVPTLMAVFPDVDRDDSSLEGTVAAIVEASFDAAIRRQAVSLTDSGELKPASGMRDHSSRSYSKCGLASRRRRCSTMPVAPRSRGMSHRPTERNSFTGTSSRPLQRRRTRRSARSTCRSRRVWRRLLNLWAYVAPELTDYRISEHQAARSDRSGSRPGSALQRERSRSTRREATAAVGCRLGVSR